MIENPETRRETNHDHSYLLREWRDVHVVIEHYRSRRLHVPLDALALHENHLGVIVRIGAHLELALLGKELSECHDNWRQPTITWVFL